MEKAEYNAPLDSDQEDQASAADAKNEQAYELPSDTSAILASFLEERNSERGTGKVEEDWQLSQFWYTEETSKRLVDEAMHALGGEASLSLACISCPSLMEAFLNREEFVNGKIQRLALFEYDKRFQEKYPDHFVYYDYNQPAEVPAADKEVFDLLLVDPPFIADECIVKVAQTIRLLAKPEAKVIFCTGSRMENLLHRLLKLKRTEFKPEHERNLANEFTAFVNYDPYSL